MSRRETSTRAVRRLRIARRRLVRTIAGRLERSHQWLPSWGLSVLVHGVILVILALIYLSAKAEERRAPIDSVVGPGPVLGEAITSVAAAESAGDPFTVGDPGEFPSLSLSRIDSTVPTIVQPRLPDGARHGPNLTAPRIGPIAGMRLTDSISGRFHVEDLTAPFSGRDPDMKARLIRREGGTVASEAAVQAGLDWIARHQRSDGAWTLEYHPQCLSPGCPPEDPTPSDTAATGLGLLPLMAAGHIHTKESRYSKNVGLGLDYLVSRQSPEGELYIDGGFNYRFYSHAIATMALCEAYGLSKDKRLDIPAQRALNFIVKNQNTDDGGWRYTPGQPGDTSVIGWQVFALRSGKLAGLEIPKRTIAGCRHYLDLASADPKMTLYTYLPGQPPKTVMTAEALLCRQYLGWPNDHSSLRVGARTVWDDLQTSDERNIYYWYYATQLLHNLGGKEWVAWNKHIRDGLIGMQVGGDGCDRGSWDPMRPQPDRWGRIAGRHYVTSLSVLTLEVYYRWLPLYRPVDASEDPKDIKDAREQARARVGGR